jgi:hypothetical protein
MAEGITILLVMPVVPKPFDAPPPFGGKAMIFFLPKKGREALVGHLGRNRIAESRNPSGTDGDFSE